MNRLIILDTETGGLIPSANGLLTISYMIVRIEQNEANELILVRETPVQVINVFEAGKLYESKALEVNNINLAEHEKVAVSSEEAARILFEFVTKHNCAQVPLCGHNIAFDVSFLRRFFSENTQYPYPFHYQTVDTITLYWALTCKYPQLHKSKRLTDIRVHYLRESIEDAHTSSGDVEATARVLCSCLRDLCHDQKRL